VTGAELFQSAAHWGYMSELSDPERRGEYQGAAVLGSGVGRDESTAIDAMHAIGGGTRGWLLIGGIVVVATLGMAPAARAADRFLQRDTAPVNAGSAPA
jgi:hypothetical protein